MVQVEQETPILSYDATYGMKGAVYVELIDLRLPNQQKRTVNAFAKELKKLINPEDLDEGFIEIHEVSDVVELINYKEEKLGMSNEKKMKGDFWKFCGQCGALIESTDFDDFLKKLKEHPCNKVAG